MKLAISGKGGVGKSTLAAALALLLAERRQRVLAVDADPDANLAAALGLSAAEQAAIVPISRQVELVEERTGAKVNQYGQMFKLNPEVADIADGYAVTHRGVALLVLGAVKQGGSGCACPESILLRALVTDLVLYKNEALVMDMEAGVEHLGRATTRGVDAMLIVVEPGQRAVDCAKRVLEMGAQIGIKRYFVVANKVTNAADEAFVRQALPGLELLGVVPACEALRACDRPGVSVLDRLSAAERQLFVEILDRLEKEIAS